MYLVSRLVTLMFSRWVLWSIARCVYNFFVSFFKRSDINIVVVMYTTCGLVAG